MNQSGISLKSCIGLLAAMSIGVIGGWLLRSNVSDSGETLAVSSPLESANLARSSQADLTERLACPITPREVQSYAYTPGIASSFSLQAAFTSIRCRWICRPSKHCCKPLMARL